MREQTEYHNEEDSRSNSRLNIALKEMDKREHTSSVDQIQQFRNMVGMDRKIRAVESSYASLYSKVTKCEKELAKIKEMWGSQ